MSEKLKTTQTPEWPTGVAQSDPPLPPELAKAGPLTPAQKKKHEKRRDALMALRGTAARLSNEEQALNHARISSDLYQRELDRLLDLQTQPATKSGLKKRDLARVIKTTAHNLSDALREQGLLGQAFKVLMARDPKSPKLEHLADLGLAHDRADDDHCPCPPQSKSVSRVFSHPRGEFVDLVKCACGHMNATTQLPTPMIALSKARSQAHEGASDAAIISHAERLNVG